MADAQDTLQAVQHVEPEDYSDDGSWTAIVADWMEDLIEQQIPGSVVVLIVVVAFLPMLVRAVGNYFKHRRGGKQ